MPEVTAALVCTHPWCGTQTSCCRAAFEAELNHFLHDVISAGGGSRAHQHGETNA
jgi:hypothetical protein